MSLLLDNLFVDTCVLLHAHGGDHPARLASRALLHKAEVGATRLHIGAETVQEFLFHRMRRVDRSTAVDQAQLVRGMCVTHPLDDLVMDRAIALIETTEIRGRDAFIAGTALRAGFDSIVTTDARFVQVPGLRRVDPRELSTKG